LGKVEYKKSFHQHSYTCSNDEIVLLNVAATREEGKCCDWKGGMKCRTVTEVSLECEIMFYLGLFKNFKNIKIDFSRSIYESAGRDMEVEGEFVTSICNNIIEKTNSPSTSISSPAPSLIMKNRF